MRNVYLIALEGQGDEHATVVDQVTWDWIHSDYQESESNTETPPAGVKFLPFDEDEGTVMVTPGSWDNDRAIAVLSNISGYKEGYFDISEAREAITENGDTLVDEYQGYIY